MRISGFGNVAWGAALEAAASWARKCVTISGPDGYIYDPDGVSTGDKGCTTSSKLRASGKNICAPYAEKYPRTRSSYAGKKPWGVCQDFDAEVDLYIPCATAERRHTRQTLRIYRSNRLSSSYCEGANMSSNKRSDQNRLPDGRNDSCWTCPRQLTLAA